MCRVFFKTSTCSIDVDFSLKQAYIVAQSCRFFFFLFCEDGKKSIGIGFSISGTYSAVSFVMISNSVFGSLYCYS